LGTEVERGFKTGYLVTSDWIASATPQSTTAASVPTTRVHAECNRQGRLNDPTSAELAFAALLDDMRLFYDREKVFLNGDRYILADFYFNSRKLVSSWTAPPMTGRKITTLAGIDGCSRSMASERFASTTHWS
jgi:hypothetical protein